MTSPSLSASPVEATDIVRYRRILHFLKRKWWIPVLLMALAGGGHALYLVNTPGDYTAVSRMWVGGRVRIPESSFFTEEWQNFFGTQIELIQSEKIRVRALTTLAGKKVDVSQSPRKLDVTQPRKTTIFNLSLQGTDPEFLSAYLNTVMEEYLKYKKEVRASSSDDTVASLGEQLEKVENDLKAEQDRISDFQRTNNLSVLQGAAVSAGNQLARLRLQLGDLQLEHDTLELTTPEENLERRSMLLAPIASRSAENPATSLPTDYLSARQQRELKRYEQRQKGLELLPEHPTMVKLAEDIARVDAVLELLRKQSQEDLDESRRRAEMKIRAVTAAVRGLEPQVAEMNQRLADYERIKASLDRLSAQQTRLLQAMHNVGVNKSVDQESVSVMERAVVFPTPRRIPYQAGLSSLVACIVGLGLILLVERLDQRVMTLAEARSLIRLPILGCLPFLPAGRGEEKTARIRSTPAIPAWIESLRRTRIALSATEASPGLPGRVLLIASATMGEGRTLVTAQLAMSLANAGFSTLVIDADVQHQELTRLLSQPNRAGLSELAASQTALDPLVFACETPGLSVMGGGENPAALERQAAMNPFRERLAELRKRFDYVLFDSPPVLSSSEACSLGGIVDGVVFVTRLGSTRLPAIQEALHQLRMSGGKVIGLVLNHVRSPNLSFHSEARGVTSKKKSSGRAGNIAPSPSQGGLVSSPDLKTSAPMAKG